MLVQSKQGDLAGADGSTDAPTFGAEANHDAYKVLHDQLYSWQYGDDDNATIVDCKVKVNQGIRYKDQGSTAYSCDKPVYLWFISQTPLVLANIVQGRYQIYFDDV